jgi:hypothetical protein
MGTRLTGPTMHGLRLLLKTLSQSHRTLDLTCLANGAYWSLTWNSSEIYFFGSGLSAPIFGAVITLINEERTATGKGPVGFINPVLYSHPHVMNDVVNGSNGNCGTPGFKAVPGWDPVTGLGTPNCECDHNTIRCAGRRWSLTVASRSENERLVLESAVVDKMKQWKGGRS